MGYVCIHNHLYQPPRENPWLEAIEQQDCAYPYQDGNDRITVEFYSPHSASRILDDRSRIADRLETSVPQVYHAILSAHREGHESIGGQAIWGIRDFEHRFGRKPQGMWLPETAVSPETLNILAQFGIEFTILAPRRAKGVRKIGKRNWHDVEGEQPTAQSC